jgi:hypothetical protein
VRAAWLCFVRSQALLRCKSDACWRARAQASTCRGCNNMPSRVPTSTVRRDCLCCAH